MSVLRTTSGYVVVPASSPAWGRGGTRGRRGGEAQRTTRETEIAQAVEAVETLAQAAADGAGISLEKQAQTVAMVCLLICLFVFKSLFARSPTLHACTHSVSGTPSAVSWPSSAVWAHSG